MASFHWRQLRFPIRGRSTQRLRKDSVNLVKSDLLCAGDCQPRIRLLPLSGSFPHFLVPFRIRHARLQPRQLRFAQHRLRDLPGLRNPGAKNCQQLAPEPRPVARQGFQCQCRQKSQFTVLRRGGTARCSCAPVRVAAKPASAPGPWVLGSFAELSTPKTRPAVPQKPAESPFPTPE